MPNRMTDAQLNEAIGNVIQDYADGLLDSLEDAVEAIRDIEPFRRYLEANSTFITARGHTAGQSR